MEALQSALPDVLVSDIGMPEEDGYALMRRVRTLHPEHGGQLPALALTAYEGDDERATAFQAGYHAFVTKPVSPAELVVTVAYMAGRGGPSALTLANGNPGVPRRRRTDSLA